MKKKIYSVLRHYICPRESTWALKDQVCISVPMKTLNPGLFVRVRFIKTLTMKITSGLPSKVLPTVPKATEAHSCPWQQSVSDIYSVTAPVTSVFAWTALVREARFHSGQLTNPCLYRGGENIKNILRSVNLKIVSQFYVFQMLIMRRSYNRNTVIE